MHVFSYCIIVLQDFLYPMAVYTYNNMYTTHGVCAVHVHSNYFHM